ncbi:MAG: hypothetical protein ACFE9C_13500 [Candidatus Hodarchaeota archaeon]
MYKIEKIGKHHLYIKIMGTFPPSVTRRFIDEFDEKTKKLKKLSVIVDGLDFIMLNLQSFEMVLNFLKKNNDRLVKSAYIVAQNPVLDKEAQILLDRADSPKRKLVSNFDEAKEWIGIKKIILEKD